VGFIDKALEKAKAEKHQTLGNQAPQASTAPPKTPLGMPPPVTGADLAAESIQYSTTRTVPVRAEVLRRYRVISAFDESPVREEYKKLRTQILQRTKAQQKNTLMVTGALPNEGKTLTAINLAISLSHEVDKTVLLVDADLRFPSVHSFFGLPPGPGLVDYLTGEASLPNLLVHPEGFEKLVILPGGKAVTGVAELIGSPMMGNLVSELKHFYPDRYVLFDLPPVLSFADPLAFAPFVDGIIIVVEMGKTPRDDIQKCVELLKHYPILGLVLNKGESLGHQDHHYYSQPDENAGSKKGLLGWIRS
jgi:exopolysaccharide/PEP-CTERM locus tyrosine autokinase